MIGKRVTLKRGSCLRQLLVRAGVGAILMAALFVAFSVSPGLDAPSAAPVTSSAEAPCNSCASLEAAFTAAGKALEAYRAQAKSDGKVTADEIHQIGVLSNTRLAASQALSKCRKEHAAPAPNCQQPSDPRGNCKLLSTWLTAVQLGTDMGGPSFKISYGSGPYGIPYESFDTYAMFDKALLGKLVAIRPADPAGAETKDTMLAIARRVWMLRAQRGPIERQLNLAAAEMRHGSDPAARLAAIRAYRAATADLADIDRQIFQTYSPIAASKLNRALSRLQSKGCNTFVHPLPAAPEDIRLTPAEKRKAEASRRNWSQLRTDSELPLWTLCTVVGLKGAVEAFKSWVVSTVGGQFVNIPTDLCSAGAASLTGLMWINEHAAGREAADPPRADFRANAPGPASTLMRISAPRTQAKAAATFQRLLNALYREGWLRNSVVTSLERAQGASQAGSPTHLRQQRATTRRLALDAVAAVKERLAAQAAVVKEFKSAGISGTYKTSSGQAAAFGDWRASHTAAIDAVITSAGGGLLTRTTAIADITEGHTKSASVQFPETLDTIASRRAGLATIQSLSRIADSLRP